MTKKILTVGEIKEGELRNVSLEVIAAGRQVAAGGEVVSVLLGKNSNVLAEKLFQYGADRVITADQPELHHYTTDAYQQALLQIIETEKPDGLIMGHTATGKDLSPRIASKLNAGLISDAISVEEKSGQAVFTRPIYSGKAFETRVIKEGMILATIRPNNISPLAADESKIGKLENTDVEIKDIRTIVKEIARKAATGVDLTEAKIVVSGGRGVKSAEGFTMLQKLADVLGGAVGASRGACDAEYCDYSLQIGQTGKVVTPDLYIACGISGAIQHLAGMSNSKVIVAINKDPDAAIFEVADYGIVGDLFEIVPLLTEELKKELNIAVV